MHMVSCKICSIVEHKERLLVPKLDELTKHNGRKKCKIIKLDKAIGNFYVIHLDSQHVWNENIYGLCGHNNM
jgi:hypothetical protein